MCVYHSSLCETIIPYAEVYNLTEKQVETYDDCLSKIICNVSIVSCYQGDCKVGPGIQNLLKSTEHRFSDNKTDNIPYKQWMTTDRQTLQTTVESYSDLLESFADKLNILLQTPS